MGGCNRWCVVTSHYLTGLDSLSRERSVLFGLNKLVLEMEMEKEIYVYSQGIALCTLPTYLPTYLMHNVGTGILLIFFLFLYFFFKESSTLALKFSNLTLQPNPFFFLQH